MKKNVLVTGGAGYIGSHACKLLSQAGYQPVVYDNLSRGHRWAVKWGPLEVGDILDKERLLQVMKTWMPSAILHFAAFAYVGESVAHPDMYYQNNTAGSLTLLTAAKEAMIRNIVFSSTCAVYGEPETLPLTESHPLKPINPYGFSKMVVERMLSDMAAAYGCRYIILRYFNAAGADPECDIGEVHEPETHLIPLLLDVAAGKSPFAKVFGDDYSTTDGTCVRDFIHVSDLAQAHLLAIEALAQGKPTSIYNLGNGHGFSVREIIDTVASVSGCTVPAEVEARRPGDPAVLVSNSGKILAALNWKPRYPDIADIVSSAWRWHRKYFG